MGNLLVLGGTAWLGAEIARQGVAAGIDVTCLARGASGSVPSGARLVVADRTGEAAYADVADRDWDAVVDVSWQPGMVRRAVAALGERSAHWTCVSSVSAYRVDSATGQHEGALLLEPWPDDVASIEEYGPAKSACESFVRNALGERSLVARLGLIGGPGDPSDRFGYWPARLARAVEDPVLVPAGLQQPTQTIDVRDAAAFVLQAEQRQLTGVVNVVGASVPLGEVLAAAAGAAGHVGPWRVASEAFLVDHDVQGWAGPRSLPLWLPQAEAAAFGSTPDGHALTHGLERRPLADTITDVLDDERARGLQRSRRAGLTAIEERDLISRMSLS
jgi:2'-hydroxyisoflavone reductase